MITDEEMQAVYNEAIDGEGKTVFDGLHAIYQLGRQRQRESDAELCINLSFSSGGGKATTPGGACIECAEAISENTGDK